MSKVILHVGMHKTGSTSIQAALGGYDDGNVRYADLGIDNHSMPLVALFTSRRYSFHVYAKEGRSREYIDAQAQKYGEKLDRELANPAPVLILSAEGISTFDTVALCALRDRTLASGREIEVIAYLRDPYSYAASMLQQEIRGGQKDLTLPRPNYRGKFSAYGEIFGADRVTFRKFDPAAFTNGSVVQDFAEFSGIDATKFTERHANESGSLGAVQLLYQFNSAMPVTAGRPELFRARQNLINLMFRHIEGPKFRVPHGYLTLPEGVNEDVDWAAEALGVDFRPAMEAAAAAPHPGTLEEFFAEIDPATIEALENQLRRLNLPVSEKHSPGEKVALLYLQMVITTSKRFARREQAAATPEPPAMPPRRGLLGGTRAALRRLLR